MFFMFALNTKVVSMYFVLFNQPMSHRYQPAPNQYQLAPYQYQLAPRRGKLRRFDLCG